MAARVNIPADSDCDTCRLYAQGWCAGFPGGAGCPDRDPDAARPHVSAERVILPLAEDLIFDPACRLGEQTDTAACGPAAPGWEREQQDTAWKGCATNDETPRDPSSPRDAGADDSPAAVSAGSTRPPLAPVQPLPHTQWAAADPFPASGRACDAHAAYYRSIRGRFSPAETDLAVSLSVNRSRPGRDDDPARMAPDTRTGESRPIGLS